MFCLLVVVGRLAVIEWNPGGVACGTYRDRLVAAKFERLQALANDEERDPDAVANAARDAREHGCDVDDLIDPSVGG